MSVESILESIEKLTLLEAAELVKAMEEKFGVSAAAPVAVAAVAAAPAEAAADTPNFSSIAFTNSAASISVNFSIASKISFTDILFSPFFYT